MPRFLRKLQINLATQLSGGVFCLIVCGWVFLLLVFFFSLFLGWFSWVFFLLLGCPRLYINETLLLLELSVLSKYYSLCVIPRLTFGFEMQQGGTGHSPYLGLITSCTGGVKQTTER